MVIYNKNGAASIYLGYTARKEKVVSSPQDFENILSIFEGGKIY
jgi:hypothetical protein